MAPGYVQQMRFPLNKIDEHNLFSEGHHCSGGGMHLHVYGGPLHCSLRMDEFAVVLYRLCFLSRFLICQV